MRLNNKLLFDFLKSKEIYMLYHANTVSTSVTYFENNGLLSRGAVESLQLFQTPQSSDEVDKIVNVWDDVFLDTTDLHTYFRRQNHYGPVLYEFKSELVLNEDYEIWVTKDNPIYWNTQTTDEAKYFQSIEELEKLWGTIARQKKMITIRNNSKPILFEYANKVIVDDPRVKISNGEGGQIHLFNQAVEKVKKNVLEGHILKGKFITRECSNCFCRDNYLNQLSIPKLKNIFL